MFNCFDNLIRTIQKALYSRFSAIFIITFKTASLSNRQLTLNHFTNYRKFQDSLFIILIAIHFRPQ